MKITNAEFLTSVAELSSAPRAPLPTIAFAGRSNVGKSSLINTILNRKSLAKTSSKPGKTRFINYYTVNEKVYFADLPGYGFVRIPRSVQLQWKQLLEPYLLHNKMLRRVFVLVDIRHNLNDMDIQLLDFLDYSEKAAQIILTKYDKVSKARALQKKKEVMAQYNVTEEPILFSAVKKIGVSDVWKAIRTACGI
ncbi:ribosome biogenesis GTP-binding protein YihA/YsxC [candidate division KSB1 bacterium]